MKKAGFKYVHNYIIYILQILYILLPRNFEINYNSLAFLAFIIVYVTVATPTGN